MNKNEILVELKNIKKIVDELSTRLSIIVENVNEINESSQFDFSKIIKNDKLLGRFIDFLVNIKHLKKGSISDYVGELGRIRIKFKEFMSITLPYEIYEIDDLDLIRKLNQAFKDNGDFIQFNLKSHHSLSAAFNNYVSFLEYSKSAFVLDEE